MLIDWKRHGGMEAAHSRQAACGRLFKAVRGSAVKLITGNEVMSREKVKCNDREQECCHSSGQHEWFNSVVVYNSMLYSVKVNKHSLQEERCI
jgi:hypothetical protein